MELKGRKRRIVFYNVIVRRLTFFMQFSFCHKENTRLFTMEETLTVTSCQTRRNEPGIQRKKARDRFKQCLCLTSFIIIPHAVQLLPHGNNAVVPYGGNLINEAISCHTGHQTSLEFKGRKAQGRFRQSLSETIINSLHYPVE